MTPGRLERRNGDQCEEYLSATGLLPVCAIAALKAWCSYPTDPQLSVG